VIKGWDKNDWGSDVAVDLVLQDADAGDFDALVLPGGVINPDQLRIIPKAVDLVKSFVEAGKPVAAICHGPWMLVEADVVRGKMVTSWRSLKTDIGNAGGRWVDQEVVESGGLITSRNPGDIPAFAEALIEAIASAKQQPHLQLMA
jgi:protease I